MTRHCVFLQTKRDLLLATMDVFVKEPLLDWQVYAKREAKDRGLSQDVRLRQGTRRGRRESWYTEGQEGVVVH